MPPIGFLEDQDLTPLYQLIDASKHDEETRQRLKNEANALALGKGNPPSKDLQALFDLEETQNHLGDAYLKWLDVLAGGQQKKPTGTTSVLFSTLPLLTVNFNPQFQKILNEGINSAADIKTALDLIKIISPTHGKSIVEEYETLSDSIQIKFDEEAKNSSASLRPRKYIDRNALFDRVVTLKKGESLLGLIHELVHALPRNKLPGILHLAPYDLVDPKDRFSLMAKTLQKALGQEEAMAVGAEAYCYAEIRSLGFDLKIADTAQDEAHYLKSYALFRTFGFEGLAKHLLKPGTYYATQSRIVGIMTGLSIKMGDLDGTLPPLDLTPSFVEEETLPNGQTVKKINFKKAYDSLSEMAGHIDLFKGKSTLEIMNFIGQKASALLKEGGFDSLQQAAFEVIAQEIETKLDGLVQKTEPSLAEKLKLVTPLRPAPIPAPVQTLAPGQAHGERTQLILQIVGNYFHYLEDIKQLGQVEGQNYFNALLLIAQKAPDPLSKTLFAELIVLATEQEKKAILETSNSNSGYQSHFVLPLAGALIKDGYIEETCDLMKKLISLVSQSHVGTLYISNLTDYSCNSFLTSFLKTVSQLSLPFNLELAHLAMQNFEPGNLDLVSVVDSLMQIQSTQSDLPVLKPWIEKYQTQVAALETQLTGTKFTRDNVQLAKTPTLQRKNLEHKLNQFFESPSFFARGLKIVESLPANYHVLLIMRQIWKDTQKNFSRDQSLQFINVWLKVAHQVGEAEITDRGADLKQQALDENADFSNLDAQMAEAKTKYTHVAQTAEETPHYLSEALAIAEACLNSEHPELRTQAQIIIESLSQNSAVFFGPRVEPGRIEESNQLRSFKSIQNMGLGSNPNNKLVVTLNLGYISQIFIPLQYVVSGLLALAKTGSPDQKTHLQKAVSLLVTSPHPPVTDKRINHDERIKIFDQLFTALFEQGLWDDLKNLHDYFAPYYKACLDQETRAMWKLNYEITKSRQSSYTAASKFQNTFEMIDEILSLKSLADQNLLEAKQKFASLKHQIETELTSGRHHYAATALEKAAQGLSFIPEFEDESKTLYQLTIDKFMMASNNRLESWQNPFVERLTKLTSLDDQTKDDILCYLLDRINDQAQGAKLDVSSLMQGWMGLANMASYLDNKHYPQTDLKLLKALKELSFHLRLNEQSLKNNDLLQAASKVANYFFEKEGWVLHHPTSTPQKPDDPASLVDTINHHLVQIGGFDRLTMEEFLKDPLLNKTFSPLINKPLTPDEQIFLSTLLQAGNPMEASQKAPLYFYVLEYPSLSINLKREAFKKLHQAGKISSFVLNAHQHLLDGRFPNMNEPQFFNWLAKIYHLNKNQMPDDDCLYFLFKNPQRVDDFFKRFGEMQKLIETRGKAFHWQLTLDDPLDGAFIHFLVSRLDQPLITSSNMFGFLSMTSDSRIEGGQATFKTQRSPEPQSYNPFDKSNFVFTVEFMGTPPRDTIKDKTTKISAETSKRIAWIEALKLNLPDTLKSLPEEIWAFTTCVLNSMSSERRSLILKRLQNAVSPNDQKEALVFLLEQSGHAKLGQVLSVLLPKDWQDKLEHLQDELPPSPQSALNRVMTEEWKDTLQNRIFVKAGFIDHYAGEYPEADILIEYPPIKSGSMGEVLKARLKNGQIVAIKVITDDRRTYLENTIKELEIAISKLESMGIKTIGGFDPYSLLTFYKETLIAESDFRREVKNMDTIGNDSLNYESPKALKEFSTQSLLVLDWKPSRIKLKKENLSDDEIQYVLTHLDFIFKQIFGDLHFHSDPHPGNLLFDREQQKVLLLDFGQVQQMTPHQGENLIQFLMAFGMRDHAKTLKALPGLQKQEKNLDDLLSPFYSDGVEVTPIMEGKRILLDKLPKDTQIQDQSANLVREIETFYTSQDSTASNSTAILDLLRLAAKCGLKIEMAYFQAIKTIGLIEGIVHNLDPENRFGFNLPAKLLTAFQTFYQNHYVTDPEHGWTRKDLLVQKRVKVNVDDPNTFEILSDILKSNKVDTVRFGFSDGTQSVPKPLTLNFPPTLPSKPEDDPSKNNSRMVHHNFANPLTLPDTLISSNDQFDVGDTDIETEAVNPPVLDVNPKLPLEVSLPVTNMVTGGLLNSFISL